MLCTRFYRLAAQDFRPETNQISIKTKVVIVIFDAEEDRVEVAEECVEGFDSKPDSPKRGWGFGVARILSQTDYGLQSIRRKYPTPPLGLRVSVKPIYMHALASFLPGLGGLAPSTIEFWCVVR